MRQQSNRTPSEGNRGARVSFPMRLLSAAAVPVAPLFGLALTYLLFHPPRRARHKGPGEAGLPQPEQLRAPIGGGKHLNAWLFKGDPARVVVVGHGIGLNKSASLAHAKFLHDAGYTVCLFDHRNHGESGRDGSAVGLSDKFTTDVTTLVSVLRKQEEHRSAKIAAYGFSFSTFPVFYSLRSAESGVDAIICDSGPSIDLAPLFRNFLDADKIPLPPPFHVRPSRALLEWSMCAAGPAMLRADWPPPVDGHYDKVPMLFLAGELDPILTPPAIDALASRYSHAEVHMLPGVDHLQGLKTDPEKYTSTVLNFLQRAFA
ncbi:alpha/beta hydrolase [Streptomyces abyssalis]|nr:alpha/beta fold hydrolase [Streptomyces abyssalis]